MNEIPNFTGVMASPRLRCGCAPLKRAAASHRTPKPLDSSNCRQMVWIRAASFTGCPVVRGLAFAIEIALADHFRREPERPRRAVENFLDDQHPLRPAKSAKGRLRGLVRAADETRDLDRRQEIRIVEVEHGAPHHRLREIQAPSAVRVQLSLQGVQSPVSLEARLEPCQERMALPGEGHVENARKAYAHRPARFPCAQRRDRRPRIRLHLLAAECTAHAQAFHRHLVAGKAEHARDFVLRLARMLRRGMQSDAARFIDPRNGALRLEVEMLLPADAEGSCDTHRPGGLSHIAPLQPQRPRMKAPFLNRLFDRQNCRQHFVLHHRPRRPALCRLQRLPEHPRHRLPMVHHLARKQGLAGMLLPRHVVARQRRRYARFFHRAGGIEARHQSVRVRRHHGPRMQELREAAHQVVGVQRLAGDVPARAFVRNALPRDLHAAASSRCSHQNFSSRLCDSARRYAAEPRWSLMG